MFGDYWWVFILIIFVVMVCYPTSNKKKHKRKEKMINSDFILSNIKTIANYYVGVN
jgi:hypothetical protein